MRRYCPDLQLLYEVDAQMTRCFADSRRNLEFNVAWTGNIREKKKKC